MYARMHLRLTMIARPQTEELREAVSAASAERDERQRQRQLSQRHQQLSQSVGLDTREQLLAQLQEVFNLFVHLFYLVVGDVFLRSFYLCFMHLTFCVTLDVLFPLIVRCRRTSIWSSSSGS